MDLWPHLICGLDGFVVSLGLRPCWICGFKSFMALVYLSFATACGFRLERGFVLAGYVAWLDVCPVIWVALLDSSHGRFG